MGLISLLLGNRTKKGIVSPDQRGQTEILGLEFDTIDSDDDQLSAKVSRSTIEIGSDISDHVQRQPRRVTLECTISNSPVGFLGSFRIRFGNAVQQAQEFLEALFAQGVPFDLVTGFKVHEGFVMTTLSFRRTARTGDSLQWTMVCEEIRLVESRTVGVPEALITGDAAAAASQKQDLGKQTTKAAGSKASEAGSLAFEGFKSLGLF